MSTIAKASAACTTQGRPRSFPSLCCLAAARRALLLAWALLFSVCAGAQQISLQRYGKAEGLLNQNPRCLLQDREEFLWVCTENGLYRYDGYRFQRFGEADGLENTMIYSAVEDRDGRIWVATSSDLYVGQHGHFRAVRPLGRPLAFAAEIRLRVLKDGRIAGVLQRRLLAVRDDGHGGWQSQPMLSLQQLADQPDLERLTSVYQETDGRLWLGCGEAVCSVDASGVRRWGAAEGVPRDQWHGFLRDAEGQFWARGRKSVLMLPAGGARFIRQDVPNAALRNARGASVLAQSPDGGIVLQTDHGLARRRLGHWIELTPANGLPSRDVDAVLFDRGGALWLGLGGVGLFRWLGYGHFESWTHTQGLGDNMIWALMRPPGGSLIVGSRSNCTELPARGTVAHPCGFDGLLHGEIGAMAVASDGRLWIGLNSGELMTVAPGARLARLVAQLPRFSSLMIDSRRRLWIPSRGGVFLLRPGDEVPRRVSEEHEFLDVAEDAQGGVWVAGSDGLLRYDDGSWVRARLPDRRAGPGFFSIAIARDGVLWAASRSRGVMTATIKGVDLIDPQWVSDPLVADASPMFVRLDAAQRVWVGTDYGLLARGGTASNPAWIRLTESDGLIWNDVDSGSFWADPDGSVWVGTSKGLTHISDPAPLLSRSPLPLRLLNARYAETPFAATGLQRLPWSRNAAMDLDLVSLDFDRSVESVYRYRVVGVDADWFESRSPHVHYPVIEPGNYRLEAQLVDPDRGQASAVIGFKFEVLPRWWQSLWTRGLGAALALGLVVLAWRRQSRRLTARHTAAQLQAREHHMLLERASRDSLTGLWNRAAILDHLGHAIECRTTGQALAIAVLDVDHFKRVNDTHGHAAGDAVLRELSRRLSGQLRQADLLGRYGGEELLVVLPELPYEDPPAAVDRLREAVAGRSFKVDGVEAPLSVTISIGVAWFATARGGESCTEDDAQKLFERADAALYEAKHQGRNRVVCA